MEPKQPGYNTNFGAWGGPNLDSIKELRTKYEERSKKHRQVQLNFTPEMDALYMLFERCHTKY